MTPPATSRSSSVSLSSTSDISSPGSGPFVERKLSLSVTSVYTPFTPNLPVDPAYRYPDTSEIIKAHNPPFEFPPDLFPPFPLKLPISTTTMSSGEDEEMPNGSTFNAPLSPTFIYDAERGQLFGADPKHVNSTSSAEEIKSAAKALNSSGASSFMESSKTKSWYIGTSFNPNSQPRKRAYRCPV